MHLPEVAPPSAERAAGLGSMRDEPSSSLHDVSPTMQSLIANN